MDPTKKRRLTYVTTAIIGALIVILAVLLLQQPIPTSTVPNNPGNPGGGNNTNTPPVTPPGIATQAATAIGLTGATLNGNLTSLGTATSVTVGFQYSADAGFAGMTNLTTGTRSATGALASSVTGLSSNTTYYFRAWALGGGFVTGSTLTFRTTVAPTTPPSGNGQHVPPGWAHARCPDVPAAAPAHGVRARCEHNETYGQLKKGGQGSLAALAIVFPQIIGSTGALRGSDPRESGDRLPGSRKY